MLSSFRITGQRDTWLSAAGSAVLRMKSQPIYVFGVTWLIYTYSVPLTESGACFNGNTIRQDVGCLLLKQTSWTSNRCLKAWTSSSVFGPQVLNSEVCQYIHFLFEKENIFVGWDSWSRDGKPEGEVSSNSCTSPAKALPKTTAAV